MHASVAFVGQAVECGGTFFVAVARKVEKEVVATRLRAVFGAEVGEVEVVLGHAGASCGRLEFCNGAVTIKTEGGSFVLQLLDLVAGQTRLERPMVECPLWALLLTAVNGLGPGDEAGPLTWWGRLPTLVCGAKAHPALTGLKSCMVWAHVVLSDVEFHMLQKSVLLEEGPAEPAAPAAPAAELPQWAVESFELVGPTAGWECLYAAGFKGPQTPFDCDLFAASGRRRPTSFTEYEQEVVLQNAARVLRELEPALKVALLQALAALVRRR